MAEKIRVILPKKYDLVVGDTFQLFYRGVIEAPNPYVYAIVPICEKGRNLPRYFEFTPEAAGRHKLKLCVYDAARNLVGYGETILNVVVPKKPEKCVNIMCIGDSITAGGTWIREVQRRVTETEGAPAGLGFENAVNFVGTASGRGCHFEAYGGWTWGSFLNGKKGSILVECPNSRTEEDQHSIWRDINGALWQLEGLQVDYLKFTRYLDHDSPRPEHGPLVHEKNAADTSNVEFNLSFDGNISPFYDEEKNCLDVASYAKRNNIPEVDAFYIFLGTNGLMATDAQTLPRTEYCKRVVKRGKELVGMLREVYPNAKVKIMGLPIQSIGGGNGASYGADLPLTDNYEIIYYKKELDLAYEAWCEEEDYMEFINLSGQFDCEYGYPTKQKPVNTRSEILETIDTNSVHPNMGGYMQIADAVYRNVVSSFCSE